MNELEEKIDIIDTIIKDEDALNEYINTLEGNDIKSPSNLKDNIINCINSQKITNKKSKKSKVVYILKIAACTILSLIIYRTMTLLPNTMMKKDEDTTKKESYFLVNTSDFYRKINGFLYKQINIERREE